MVEPQQSEMMSLPKERRSSCCSSDNKKAAKVSSPSQRRGPAPTHLIPTLLCAIKLQHVQNGAPSNPHPILTRHNHPIHLQIPDRHARVMHRLDGTPQLHNVAPHDPLRNAHASWTPSTSARRCQRRRSPTGAMSRAVNAVWWCLVVRLRVLKGGGGPWVGRKRGEGGEVRFVEGD